MNVLFVCSGNSKQSEITSFIKSQADSLIEKGVQVDFYIIKGRGLVNYVKSIFYLKKNLRQNSYNIIHAHYSLSGWVAVLAYPKIPIVLSLMGTDALGMFVGRQTVKFRSRFYVMLTYLVQPFVKAIISKSPGIEEVVYRKKISYIIPNGVQLTKFFNSESGFRSELGLKKDVKYVLFLADPGDGNKNYALARAAVDLLGRKDIELINIFKESTDNVVKYLNSVDVFVSCSFSEGSANVIKEAMACNCPMVVTNAGDAEWLIGETPGCFISSYDPAIFANDLIRALEFSDEYRRTNGRKRLCELELNSESVVKKIIQVYKNVLLKK